MAHYMVMSQTEGGCLQFEIITPQRDAADLYIQNKQAGNPNTTYMVQEFPDYPAPSPTPSAVQHPPAPVPIPSQEAPPAPSPSASPTF